MTVTEVKNALTALGIDENVWLHETKPWEKIASICTQSTYHVYLDRNYDYRFNSDDETLEIAILDDGRSIKKAIDYTSIVCFNGVHYLERGVPIMKSFR
jgi:hypothetical protein